MSTFPGNLLDMTEQEWDGQLFRSDKALAKMLGWRLCYHTLRSKGSKAGFPDRVLVRERIVYVELKSMTGKPTEAQVEWLDGLAKAGGECYLWKPSDLDEIGKILSKRWHLDGLHLINGTDLSWIPNSLWVPGIGRWDQREPEEPEVPGQLALA